MDTQQQEVCDNSRRCEMDTQQQEVCDGHKKSHIDTKLRRWRTNQQDIEEIKN